MALISPFSSLIRSAPRELVIDSITRKEKNEKTTESEIQQLHERQEENVSASPSSNIWRCLLGLRGITFLNLLFATAMAICIYRSYTVHLREEKKCESILLYPAYIKQDGFDGEHTRFSHKYSLYLYREYHLDASTKPRGIPVIFIPGNAGSYKQVRSLAAASAKIYGSSLDENGGSSFGPGASNLDFFTVDLNADYSAFHGGTIIDQALTLNEMITYILSLYADTRRNTIDPASVIIVGHSMGGMVARLATTMKNHPANSINTIVTFSTPHTMPPAPVDGNLYTIYDHVNSYWRSQLFDTEKNRDSFADMSLISIAGGSLDDILTSDYTCTTSIVPPDHGFSVFTSSIPNVWTGTDHLEILWCDQIRQAVARSLLEIVDQRRSSQTKDLETRMAIFRRNLLTGLEPECEHEACRKDSSSNINIYQNIKDWHIVQEPKLELTSLAKMNKPYLIAIPEKSKSSQGNMSMHVLSNRSFSKSNSLEISLCKVQTAKRDDKLVEKTQLACLSIGEREIMLPQSSSRSLYYIKMDVPNINPYDYIAIKENKNSEDDPNGFLIAQTFSDTRSRIEINSSPFGILLNGIQVEIPTDHSMVTEIALPLIKNSLLAFKFQISARNYIAENTPLLFKPLVQQYYHESQESKFFIDATTFGVHFHGIAPFATAHSNYEPGLLFRIWTDPKAKVAYDVFLEYDFYGTLGNLYLRYRFVILCFPILIVSMLAMRQYSHYFNKQHFLSIDQALLVFIRKDYVTLLVFTMFFYLGICMIPIYFQVGRPDFASANIDLVHQASENFPELTKFKVLSPKGLSETNSLFIGLREPFFFWLPSLFIVMSVGLITISWILILALIRSVYWVTRIIGYFVSNTTKTDKMGRSRFRVIYSSIIITLLTITSPFQVALIALCIVQFVNCVLLYGKQMQEHQGPKGVSLKLANFAKFSNSLLFLLLWTIPINVPMIMLWIKNLLQRSFTQYSTVENIIVILPFAVLVEMISAGQMLPMCNSKLRKLIDVSLGVTVALCIVYGSLYTYILQYSLCLFAASVLLVYMGAHVGKTGPAGEEPSRLEIL